MMDYCLRLMDALEQMERSIFKVNDLRRQLEYEANRLVNRQAFIAGLVLPVLLLIAYTISGSGIIENVEQTSAEDAFLRMFGAGFITWTLSITINMFLKALWYRDYLPQGPTMKKRHLLPKYRLQKEQIIQETQQVIDPEVLDEAPIPEEEMAIPTLEILMTYLADHRAANLDEALGIYRQEVGDLSLSEQSIVKQFKEIQKEDYLLRTAD